MAIARRDFLKVVGSASIAGTVGYAAPAMSAMGDVPAFGFSDNRVPMNAANLCPMPASVSIAHGKYAYDLDVDLSNGNRRRITAYKEDARSRIAALLNVSADELAIVRNTSEANNVLVQGIDVDENDEILLWDQNHPSNLVAWDVRAKRSGCSVRRFSVPADAGSIDEVVDTFVNAVGDKTRVVSFTHISNITGLRTPVNEICAALRKRKGDLHIHVDGAQTWGAVDIDLGAVDCDTFSGSAHKWFMGPREVGLLFVRDSSIDKLWPTTVSVPWGQLDAPPKGARKFDALGQRDDAAIAALSDAAKFHEEMTPVGIERRSKEVADYLREGLRDLDLPFVSSHNPAFTSSVIILRTPQGNGSKLVEGAFQDSGVVTAATGGFRMSPHVYNTADHADRIIGAIRKARSSFVGA